MLIRHGECPMLTVGNLILAHSKRHHFPHRIQVGITEGTSFRKSLVLRIHAITPVVREDNTFLVKF